MEDRSEAQMRLLCGNVKLMNPETGKRVSFDVVWKDAPSRREVVRLDFLPHRPEVFVPTKGGDVLNTSPGFLVERQVGFVVDGSKLEMLLYHLRYVWACGHEPTFNYLIGFFADMVQRPERKAGVALVLRSQQGAGKNIILTWMGEYILGDLYVSIATMKQLKGGFNNILVNRLLVNFDEVEVDKETEGLVRAMTTQKEGVHEKKGVDAAPVSTSERLIFSANADEPVPVSTDDRRNACVELADVAEILALAPDYFSKLAAALDQECAEHFFQFLWQWSAPWVPKDVPTTPWRRLMQATQQPAAAAFLQDTIEEGSFVTSPTASALWNDFKSWAESRGRSHLFRHPHNYSDRKFSLELGAICGVYSRTVRRPDSKGGYRHYFYGKEGPVCNFRLSQSVNCTLAAPQTTVWNRCQGPWDSTM